MTQYEIVEMAEQAGFDPHDMSSDFTCNLQNINAFAKLVAEKAIKEALEQQAVVEHDLAATYRTELDKLSQRNYELRMENAQLKAQPKEPEQEPVAWMNDNTPSGIFARHIDGARNFGCTIPLYTTPPQRKPLTDEQIAKIASTPAAVVGSYVHTFARAIEAAHGIKE